MSSQFKSYYRPPKAKPVLTPEQQAMFQLGKDHEKLFSEAARNYFHNDPDSRFQRLMDTNKNAQHADYYFITPGLTVFLELKATSKAEFPLINIKDHQLQDCCAIDESTPFTRAGFVIQFASRNNETWYLPAQAAKRFVDLGLGRYIGMDYFEKHAIRIKTFKVTPRSRHYRGYDFASFLAQLKAQAVADCLAEVETLREANSLNQSNSLHEANNNLAQCHPV